MQTGMNFTATTSPTPAPALARPGSEIEIRGERGEMLKARVTPTPFYDPKNARQRPVAAA